MAKRLTKNKLLLSMEGKKSLSGKANKEAKRLFCDYCNAKTKRECICHVEDEIHPFSDDAFQGMY